MGEKGDPTEVVSQLRQLAANKPPGVRDQIMDMLNDYQTVRTAVTGYTGDEDEDEGGQGTTPPAPGQP